MATTAPLHRCSLLRLVGTLILMSAFQPATVRAAAVDGLIGDGRADDTAAIQAAVDSKLGSLEFGRGTYRLTRPIVINLDRVGWTSLSGNGVARFQMDGAGPAFRFIGSHQGTAAPQTVRDEVWTRQRSPMIDGIEIVGNHAKASGIEAEGTMQLTMTRIVVRKALHGIRLFGRNRNVTLSNCHLYENRGVGVFLDDLNLHQINIIGCHISYNAGGGVVSLGSEIRNLQIGTCDIEGNMGDANSKPTANILLDSRGTSVGEVAIVGCTIQHSHLAPDSANIRINGLSNTRPFTSEQKTGNITIADNVLSDVQTNIELTSVRGITVSGNTLWKGYSANFVARDCDQVVMTGNLYDRSPRYHYGDGPDAKLGVLLKRCKNVTVTGEHFGGDVNGAPAVLQILNCEGVNLTGCTFARVAGTGILVESMTFGQILGCLFTGTRPEARFIRQVGKNDLTLQSNRARTIAPNSPRSDAPK